MGAADPIFKTPTKAPAAPVASPAPLAPYDPDPYYGTNTKTPAAMPAPAVAPAAMPAPAVAPTAPQQPYVNPFMQTYGQNNTPQQQMFNRFPQRFQQPQPVAQPAQGPVYADQSLNAPGNQPQQFQQPQYGRFGRGFMPQNRGGYERQMDQLRGGYNRPMPPMMPQQDGGYGGGYGQQQPGGMQQAAFMNSLLNGQQPVAVQPSAPAGGKGGNPTSNELPKGKPFFGDPRGFNNGATPALNTQASSAGAAALGQLNPFQAALVKGGTPYVQGAPGAPYAIGQNIPGGAPGGYMPLMNSNGTPVSSLASANPAGGKGGNPTAQLPPPPNQDGTPGSWSTYI